MTREYKKLSKSGILWIVAGLLVTVLNTQLDAGIVMWVYGIASILYVVHVKEDTKWQGWFGVASVVSYILIAFAGRIYGDFAQNLLWQLPMLLLLAFDKDSKSVLAKVRDKITSFHPATVGFVTFGVLAFGLTFFTNDPTPILDATTTSLAMVAVVFLSARKREQWIFWVASNGLSVIMWYLAYGYNPVMFVFLFYLVNSIDAFIKAYGGSYND